MEVRQQRQHIISRQNQAKFIGNNSQKHSRSATETQLGWWHWDKMSTQIWRQRLGPKYKTGVETMRHRRKQSGQEVTDKTKGK